MTDKTTTKNWNDELVATLLRVVGDESPVSVEGVERAATELGKTTRSIASKLRQLDRDVVSLAKEKSAAFTAAEGDALAAFVNDANCAYTYKDIAAEFAGAKFSAKQIQGKLLALELTSKVKPADKVEVANKYSEAEEAVFITMANDGAFIEDIAAAMGREVNSIRGKALSLSRKELISKIPAQRESHAKEVVDPVLVLGDSIATMTVAEIAAAVDKTERGIKTLLTRRGIDCADYKGKQKREKAEAKAA